MLRNIFLNFIIIFCTLLGVAIILGMIVLFYVHFSEVMTVGALLVVAAFFYAIAEETYRSIKEKHKR